MGALISFFRKQESTIFWDAIVVIVSIHILSGCFSPFLFQVFGLVSKRPRHLQVRPISRPGGGFVRTAWTHCEPWSLGRSQVIGYLSRLIGHFEAATFVFDVDGSRFHQISGDVLLTTPGDVKSLELRFLEQLDLANDRQARRNTTQMRWDPEQMLKTL